MRERFPAVYGHVRDEVKPHRDTNARATYRNNWFTFGEPRSDLRAFVRDLDRFVDTVETTRHRRFRFLDAGTLPDNELIAIGLDDQAVLPLLSSRGHVHWSIEKGSWMGVGNDPVYTKTEPFDPYPFPALLTDPAGPEDDARLERLRELGRRLEALRAHPRAGRRPRPDGALQPRRAPARGDPRRPRPSPSSSARRTPASSCPPSWPSTTTSTAPPWPPTTGPT